MDRGLLNDATSSDDSPTPGYMLSEIARSTLANYTACLQLEEYLCAKLAKGNHNSKFKCLVLIKHVCRTGRVDFKKDMCKHVEVVKECLQFKGPPDPLRGDEIYRRVREAAKEVLDVLFDSSMPVTTSSVAASNRIQGFGSNYTPEEDPNAAVGSGGTGKSYFKSVTSAISNAMGSGVGADGTTTKYTNYNPEASAANPNPGNAAASPSMHSSTYNGAASVNNRYGGSASGSQASPTVHTSASGMSGIGNPNFRDPRDESGKSSVSNYINKASAYLSGGGSGGGNAAAGGRGPALGEISYNNTGASGSSDYNFASNRGVYTPSSSSGGGDSGGGGGGGVWQNGQGGTPASAAAPAATVVVPEFAAPAVPGQGKAGTAAADGTYESNLVAALVQPSGMKVVVPVDSAPVQNFLRCAVTLNADVIGGCMSSYLSLEEGNSTPWQSRVKTLLLLGHLVGAAGCEHHRHWWVDGNAHQLVSSLCTAADSASVKPLVRSTAVKTLDLMGFDVSMYSSVAAPAPAKRGSVRVASVSPKPPGAGGAVPTTAARKESVDLLGDLCDAPAAPAPASAAAPSAFTASPPMTSAAIPAPAPVAVPAPQQEQVVDLFADMGISEASVSASVPVSAVEQPPASAPAGNKFDVFDLLDDAPAQAPSAQQTQAQGPQEEASVFSFLGSGSGGGSQTGGSPNMSAAQPMFGTNVQQQQHYGHGAQQQQPAYGSSRPAGSSMGYGMPNQGVGMGMGMSMGMAPNSMTSITAQRKEIPTEAALHSTVFGGTNNQPRSGMQQQAQQQYRGSAAPQADSFSFVQDAMKGKRKN